MVEMFASLEPFTITVSEPLLPPLFAVILLTQNQFTGQDLYLL
jgi:hypothetical protein